MRRKLNAMPAVFEGKKVLLVDDSIVRGTTMSQIVEMVRRAGAVKVGLPHNSLLCMRMKGAASASWETVCFLESLREHHLPPKACLCGQQRMRGSGQALAACMQTCGVKAQAIAGQPGERPPSWRIQNEH